MAETSLRKRFIGGGLGGCEESRKGVDTVLVNSITVGNAEGRGFDGSSDGNAEGLGFGGSGGAEGLGFGGSGGAEGLGFDGGLTLGAVGLLN